MAEKTTPFVINDRRKFTSEGELRHDIEPSSPSSAGSESSAQVAAETASRSHAEPIEFPSAPAAVQATGNSREPGPVEMPASPDESDANAASLEDELPPAPSAEQIEQATRAYDATVDRLDTAIRASNPGADRIPEMSFDRFVQSLYMQAILQLGGGAEPGQQPQVDIIGARQTIDMLSILSEKTNGNLEEKEDKLLKSALFEARMGFLEITQAIARQAAGRQPGGFGGPAGGPSIVR